MTHALGLRATSLGASAIVLGAAMIGALSMTYSVMVIGPPDVAPIISIDPAPPPPVAPPRDTIPPPARIDGPIDLPFEPLDPIAGPETPSDIAFVSGPPPAVEVTRPEWLRQPRDLARYYPARALSRGMEGVVDLECAVDVGGNLACRVASETPQNWGFGDAALRISRDYRMAPARRNGVAVEGRYRMRVPFSLQ